MTHETGSVHAKKLGRETPTAKPPRTKTPPVSQPVSGRHYPCLLLGQATGSTRRLYRFDKHHPPHCGQYGDLNIDDTYICVYFRVMLDPIDLGWKVDARARSVPIIQYMQAKQIRTDRSFQEPPQLSSSVQVFRSRHELKPACYFARRMIAIAQQSCQMRPRYPRRTGIVASDTKRRLVVGP